jgi:hypothetical protein
VHLVRSKTSQEVTKSYFIERGPAVEAVEAWVRRAGITAGSPLWRTVQGETPEVGRMAARTWDRIIKRRVAELYRPPRPHDPRGQAGGSRLQHALAASRHDHKLADAGATIAEIRDVTGHAEGSAAIMLGYMRRNGAGVKQIKKLGL